MKIVKKEIIPPSREVFTRIEGNTTRPYEIIGTGDIPIEESDFIPINDADLYLPDTPNEPGPEGPPGPTGPIGPQGPAGGGTAETWDSELPTVATNFTGIPQGSLIPLGTSSIDILKSMLYPISISFTSFDVFDNSNTRIFSIGQQIPQGAYNITWGITGAESATPNSLKISGLSDVNGDPIIFENESLSTTNLIQTHGPYVYNTETSKTFTISLTGAYNDLVKRDDVYYWRYPLYAGKFDSSTITSGDVGNLQLVGQSVPIITYTMNQLKSGVTVTVPSTTPNPKYFYWLVVKQVGSTSTNPPNYTIPVGSFSDVTDQNDPKSISMEKLDDLTMTYNNLTITFDVYRSFFDFSAQVVIKVQE